jgi:hypothetical protein
MHNIDRKKIPHQIYHPQRPKSKIGNHHCTYFKKVRAVTITDLQVDEVYFQHWERKYWWAIGAK